MFPRYSIEVSQSNEDGRYLAVVVKGAESKPMFMSNRSDLLGVLVAAVGAVSDSELNSDERKTDG